jgi:hypothetical protein
MKRPVLAAAVAIVIGSLSPAIAAEAPFGCDARAPGVCYFRIYYLPRGTRDVVLPAGMKVKIPGVEVGRSQYCVHVGVRPAGKCTRKVINGSYNS